MVPYLLLLSTTALALQDCSWELLQTLQHSLTLFPTEHYGAMAVYSGKWVNDLGDYHGCELVEGAEYVLFSLMWQGPFVGLGFCGPKSCSKDDYHALIRNFTSGFPENHAVVRFSEYARDLQQGAGLLQASSGEEIPISISFPREERPNSLSFGAVFMVFVCVLLIICVGIGTAIDAFQTNNKQVRADPGVYELTSYHDKAADPSFPQVPLLPSVSPAPTSLSKRCFRCFSLFSTLPKLFSRSDKERLSPLSSLNGLRTLSMCWIIAGHVLLLRYGSVSRNPGDIVPFMKEYQAILYYGARYAVDTFFWLSGLLLGFSLLPKLNGSLPTSKVYLYRVLRLLPAYTFALFLTWTLSVYIGAGPMSHLIDNPNEYCADYWWTNLLFLNNIVPDWLGIGCLGQSWYLAADFQMFLVAVPLLGLYSRERKWGWASFSAIIVLSVVWSGSLAWKYGYTVQVASRENAENHYTSRYYVQPFCRFAPYVLGLFCGLVHHCHSVYQVSGQVSDPFALTLAQAFSRRFVRISALILGVTVSLVLVLLERDAFQAIEDPSLAWTPAANVLYISLSRAVWGLCLSAVWLPILLGKDIGVGWVLSWELWAPLAKLSFCAYLIHVHITVIGVMSQQAAQWFGGLSLLTDFCFYTVLSYAAAVPLAVGVELPANELIRVLGLTRS